jgi:restriction system protein
MKKHSEKKLVFLASIDGFEFEKLTENIFQKLGYNVVNIQPTGDAGRDLIIEKDGIRTLIECKHQKGAVGRPIVQKLHSAVVVDKKASKGIVITSGSFSNQAIEYVKNSNVPIELIGLPELRRLAKDAGIRLLLEGEKLADCYYPLNPVEKTFKEICNDFKDKLESVPNDIRDITVKGNWSYEVKSAYRLEYRINHVTLNSTNYIIYEVNCDGVLHLSANSLDIMPDEDIYFKYASLVTDIPKDKDITSHEGFYHDPNRVKIKGMDVIRKRNSANVAYVGLNNVTYHKECIPSKKDVYIKSINPVYIILQHTPIKIQDTYYNISLYENDEKLFFIHGPNYKKCSICNKEFKNKGYICNNCGVIVEPPYWWKRGSHSFKCDICGKTICRNCAYWRSKYVFMKKILCKECMDISDEKDNYKKITISNNDEKLHEHIQVADTKNNKPEECGLESFSAKDRGDEYKNTKRLLVSIIGFIIILIIYLLLPYLLLILFYR